VGGVLQSTLESSLFELFSVRAVGGGAVNFENKRL